MTKRYKLIANPASGRGKGAQAISGIERSLQNYALDFDLVRTEYPWHASELTRQAVGEGYDVIVAVGGDGTVNEVLNGLMSMKGVGEARPALGVLCVGSGNDFAFGAGIPKDLEAGCRVLVEDQRCLVDIGIVTGGDYPQGRYFCNGIGIGFDAAAGFEAQKIKHLHGFLRYFVAAFKTIFLYYHAPRVRIEYNGRATKQLTLMISIMSGRRLGGGFMIAPQASMDDGLFDLCIADQISRPRILPLIPKFVKGTHASHPAIKTDRTDRIVVTALEGILPAHADGETVCVEGERLSLEILPRELEILYSPSEAPG
jgi:diacylglycerol kinase (ATP)